jgi:hypothetical protein
MSKLNKKQIKAIETAGWSIEKGDDGCYCLENYSPAGGEMVIEGVNSAETIIEYCENFDPEEEFNVWYGAHNGEPQSPGDLWEDCLAMGRMYSQLQDLIERYKK